MSPKRDNRKLKEILAPMSGKEKLSYLWSYYKWVPLVALLVIALLCSVIGILAEKKSEPLLRGVTVNLPVTENVDRFLTEELFAYLGGDAETQHMELQSIFFQDLLSTNDPSADRATAMKVTARVTTRSLDYVLMDEVGYDYYKNQDVFSPLEPTLQQQYAEYVVYEDGVALALDLSGTAFAEICFPGSGKVYLAFPGNTDRGELCVAFAQLLLKLQRLQ